MRISRLIPALLVCMAAFGAAPARVKTSRLTPDQRIAQRILRSMTLRDRVAQMIVGVSYGDAPAKQSAEYKLYLHWIRDLHIGGLIVNNRVHNGLVQNAEPHAMALFLNQMQRLSKTPLLVGADFERGASMRVSAGAPFPYNMAYSAARDIEASRYEGLVTAREARALGVQWLFAPVSDVNNNPANPVINIRSFGENPDEVSQHVAAYIEGAHSDPQNRVLVTAKHFPGHGDTNIDSHLGLARLDASKDRMEAVELKPFEAAIAHGADAIMTAHMAVPAIEPDNIPATASERVLTGLLRDELGFKGIIVTDAMDMQGFAKQFNSANGAVRAIQAGADVLLMPPNPDLALEGVLRAIAKGKLTRKRIDESAMRILTAKVHLGLFRTKLVDLNDVSDVLNVPEEDDRAQDLADRAITLVRNDRNVLPFSKQSCLVIAVERRLSSYGQRMSAEFRKRAPGGRVIIVDPSMPLASMTDAMTDASSCASVAVAIFLMGDTLAPDVSTFIEQLTEGTPPVALIGMGTPYILSAFPKAAASIASFSPTVDSEISAVKALFGEIPITGHLPVTLPGFASYGDGIQLAASH